MEPIILNGYYTLIAATLVLLLGRILVKNIKFLRDFNIPEPVSGGLIAAAIITTLYYTAGITFQFESALQTTFMLIFFSSIGLSADFSRLKQGGFPLVAFLIIVSIFIVLQNFVGIGLATLMGQNPLVGLLTGSITLTGGHGTGAAYGKTLSEQFGVQGAVEMAMVSATYGLVAGGLVGGPVARHLLNKMGHKPLTDEVDSGDLKGEYDNQTFEKSARMRLITAESAIETMALFAACLAFSSFAYGYMTEHFPNFKLPQFVWALGFGVLLRNALTGMFKFDMFDRAIDVFGNASLSLFLAMALMSMKLWQLAGMAGPLLVILLAQTAAMILYAYFVTFRFMGKDYDAAILTAGHCGFGLGATPTAVANMQSVTGTFGPSHKAFLIVPLVGAFFIDLVNAAILDRMMAFFG
ncbi:sodium/glutamate symporter [Wielerella bovis]|uniref:sodium/glutamate symporter n=1 Tax=Wielerella bovis TaxID=2917790 RepID=UPI0020191B9F|nr:sodium/glutamate symporter [Wielerella bovis]ULJ63409.1 sodium/glutamate symporter [Wielerella bovis]ULJ65577.1 sodium/glutamate symporter [Wielerella bovis]ULJ66379.1 sodium/glutamate symporter [Wielerella bovis]